MIKRLTVFLCAVLLVLCSSLSFANTRVLRADTSGSITKERIEAILTDFLGENNIRADRTPFSQGEHDAALYLSQVLTALGYQPDIKQFDGGDGTSQNVIAKKDGTGDKVVVVGAHYDNPYGEFSVGTLEYSGSGSHGALDNGTGVACVLALAEAVKDMSFEFDIEFVFFGAEETGSTGSYEYVKSLTASEKNNILMMFNINRIGGDNVYLYSDEEPTKQYSFMMKNSTNTKAIPANRIIFPAEIYDFFNKLPYMHYGLIGDHVPFFNADIPVAYYFGGNMSSFKIGDAESAKYQNISYSDSDTLDVLKRRYPHYSQQCADVANSILTNLTDADFLQVLQSARFDKPSYLFLTQSAVASFVRLIIVLLMLAGAFVVLKRLEKLIPPPSKPKLAKLAVFGKEYEDNESGEFIIDGVIIDPRKINPFE